MTLYDINAWLQAVVRWIHVFAVILWIGQTYLFNFFERNLRQNEGDEKIIGNLWMVHGGGFYFLEKHRFQEKMPYPLHWFKWEAAATWLSGAVLITLVYYTGGLLVEPEMSFGLGAAFGIGSILLGWIIYDGLVRSSLGKNEIAFATVSLLLIIGVHLLLKEFLSSRAAFIHIGALIGTIMTNNVWNRILPAQKKIIKIASTGKSPDPSLAGTGPLRSKHNTYLALPLVFIMISNHYPTISYGNDYSSIVLGLIMLVGWGIARIIRG